MPVNDNRPEYLEMALKNEPNTWFRIEDVSKMVPDDNLSNLEETLNQSDRFVRSANGVDGVPMYATREDFQEKAPFFQKLLGAFKNRID